MANPQFPHPRTFKTPAATLEFVIRGLVRPVVAKSCLAFPKKSMQEKTFPGTLDSLAPVRAYVTETGRTAGATPRAIPQRPSFCGAFTWGRSLLKIICRESLPELWCKRQEVVPLKWATLKSGENSSLACTRALVARGTNVSETVLTAISRPLPMTSGCVMGRRQVPAFCRRDSGWLASKEIALRGL